jgi:integrative and conjugative element protein (TIGR02256 family)
MKFSRPNGGTVEFHKSAEAAMSGYRQLSRRDAEAGGMILGRLVVESADLIVDEVTEPTKVDRKGRFFFIRRRPAAQRRVNQAWFDSNGTLNYLGEWHSHPEDDPTPSNVDIENWHRISSQARFEQDFLIFAIVGRQRTRLWELGKFSRELSELEAK